MAHQFEWNNDHDGNEKYHVVSMKYKCKECACNFEAYYTLDKWNDEEEEKLKTEFIGKISTKKEFNMSCNTFIMFSAMGKK